MSTQQIGDCREAIPDKTKNIWPLASEALSGHSHINRGRWPMYSEVTIKLPVYTVQLLNSITRGFFWTATMISTSAILYVLLLLYSSVNFWAISNH